MVVSLSEMLLMSRGSRSLWPSSGGAAFVQCNCAGLLPVWMLILVGEQTGAGA